MIAIARYEKQICDTGRWDSAIVFLCKRMGLDDVAFTRPFGEAVLPGSIIYKGQN